MCPSSRTGALRKPIVTRAIRTRWQASADASAQHPCETACRRGEIDKPIQIRALKRFLTERYGPESRHPLEIRRAPEAKLPHRVAIVGSGPVGLSAAHDLARMGYSVTIFEAASVAGGMLTLAFPNTVCPAAWWKPRSGRSSRPVT